MFPEWARWIWLSSFWKWPLSTSVTHNYLFPTGKKLFCIATVLESKSYKWHWAHKGYCSTGQEHHFRFDIHRYRDNSCVIGACASVCKQWREIQVFWTSTPPIPSEEIAALRTSWSRSITVTWILPLQYHSESPPSHWSCVYVWAYFNMHVREHLQLFFIFLFVINLHIMPNPRALLSLLCNDSPLGRGTCGYRGTHAVRDWAWYEEMSVK